MKVRDLVPWSHNDERRLARRSEESPLMSLQNEMNRLFDDFFGGFELPAVSEKFASGLLAPKVDVSETETEIEVTAEIPGIEEKDVDVTLTENSLTIRGEKKLEEESKEKNFHRIERSYGTFQRTIQLPADVDREKINATFKQGVLKVSLPKVERGSACQKIEVKQV